MRLRCTRRVSLEGCGGREQEGAGQVAVGGWERLLAVVVSCCCVLAASTAWAQFNEPTVLSDGTGQATDSVIGFDAANNAYIVSVVGGELRVDLVGPNLRTSLAIPSSGLEQGEPVIVNSSRGEAFVCFSQRDADAADSGRDICLTYNGGGRFVEPVLLSDNRVDDFAPDLSLDAAGVPHLAWARALGETTRIVYYDHETRESREVADGSYPSLWVDMSGVSHIVYTRDNDIYYVNDASGDFSDEAQILATPTEPEFNVQVRGGENGRMFLSYESGGSLYATKREAGADAFEVPSLIDREGVLEPQLRVSPSAALSIVYAKQGDVFYVLGLSPTALIGPVAVGEPTDPVEDRPSMVVDPSGIVHCVFLRDGEVYYSNNAADADAEFAADVTNGEAPLAVQFTDLTAGNVQAWRWDFGDGTTSTGPTPRHTFAAPGRYTVTMTVFTADRESRELKEDFIVVEEPSNVLWVPSQRVKQGQTEIWCPVKAENRDPIMAYQVHGVYDTTILSFVDSSLHSTATSHLTPEVYECNILEEEGQFEVGCIFDFAPPFDLRRLPPGDDHTLVNLICDIEPDAPAGSVTRIDLVNDRDISAIFNIFTVDNVSVLPTLRGGVFEILSADSPERLFLRGDVDGSQRVDITDAISLLNFLFLGGAGPACQDAADPQDVGRIDLSGAVFLLNFLFQSGGLPAVPYPSEGLDPTPDDLETCLDPL